MNLPMMRHSVMLAATVVGLTAGSDDLKPDLARLQGEDYGTLQVSGCVGGGTYRECMRAQGWPLRDACLDCRENPGAMSQRMSVTTSCFIQFPTSLFEMLFRRCLYKCQSGA
jgi:hypothetical protein